MVAQRHGRGRALTLAILSILVGVLSYVVGVLSSIGQRAEASVLSAAEFTTNPPPPLNLVSISGVALVLVLTAGLALAFHGVRRAIAIITISASAIIASQLLKQQVLQRPGLFELDAPNTFPSGHMTVFIVIVGAILWAVPERGRSIVFSGGTVLLSIVAWQLLAYGWHRPSDVLGALALGVLAFALASLISPGQRGRPAGMIPTVMTILGVIIAVVGIALTTAALLVEGTSLFLIAGEVMVVGSTILASRALLSLARR